jgi:putative ABC transport system permease protein
VADPGGVTGNWLTVVGILDPFPLAPEIDSSVLVGFPLARQRFGYDGHPSRIYVRTVTSQTAITTALLAPTAWPTTRSRYRSAARPTRSPRVSTCKNPAPRCC